MRAAGVGSAESVGRCPHGTSIGSLALVEPGTIPAESELCVACGLCCDGTFLVWAPVEPDDDVTGLAAVGHPVLESEARGRHFALPCPALVDRCCSVYGHRPNICPTYACKLLLRFREGAVDSAAALETIRTTVELRDRVRPGVESALEVSTPRSLFELFLEMDERRKQEGGLSVDPSLLLDIALLRRMLKEHFEKPRQEAGGSGQLDEAAPGELAQDPSHIG